MDVVMIIEVEAKVSPQRESLFEGKFEVLVDRWAQTWNIINSHFLCTDWYRLYDDLNWLPVKFLLISVPLYTVESIPFHVKPIDFCHDSYQL